MKRKVVVSIFLILTLCLGGCSSSKGVNKQKASKELAQTDVESKNSENSQPAIGKRLKKTKAPKVTEDIKSQVDKSVAYLPQGEGKGNPIYIKPSAYFVKDILALAQQYTNNMLTFDYRKFNYNSRYVYCSKTYGETHPRYDKELEKIMVDRQLICKAVQGIDIKELVFYEDMKTCRLSCNTHYKLIETKTEGKVTSMHTGIAILFMSYENGCWQIDSVDDAPGSI